MPQDFLDNLSNQLDARTQMWTKVLVDPQRWTWVAEGAQGIVGFAGFAPPRDADREGYVELQSIYLLASEKGCGIEFALLSAGFNAMKLRGYTKAYCWVLENNPTIEFYKKTGAQFFDQTKNRQDRRSASY